MYKEKLAFTSIIDSDVIDLINKLTSGEMTRTQYHSKKKYHKNNNDIKWVLKLSTAWEIYKLKEKHDNV